MDKFLGLEIRSEEGKICSPCYCTPTTCIIQLLDLLQSFQFRIRFYTDIDSLNIPGIHEVPHADVLQFNTRSLLVQEQ